jgi:putative thioredoxin
LLPEESIREWLQRILPSAAELLAAEARELEEVDPQAAEAKYREALEQSPHEVAARIGLARTVFSHGNVDEARQIIQELADAGLLDAEGERLHAEILLKSQAAQTGSVAQCRVAVEADPGNLSLQLDLARALAAEGQYEESLETCLRVVQKDRRGMGEPARELMVHLFHVLGPESDLASAYRRKLALALY